MVTRQLQVERRTEKVRRPKTDVRHATNLPSVTIVRAVETSCLRRVLRSEVEIQTEIRYMKVEHYTIRPPDKGPPHISPPNKGPQTNVPLMVTS